MRRLVVRLAAGVFLAAAISDAVHAEASPAASIDAIFQDWTGPDHPGCAVGVRHGDQPPIFRAYGSADLEHGAAITPETVFEAGSVSKQFTAAAILLLAGEGKLALSDDARKYLPELPDYGAPVTIAELLGHTSGLRDWGEVEALAGWPRTERVYNLTDVLALMARQKALNDSPGTHFAYTNTGYTLAALIVQRVSGQSLADFTHAHLFVPLGMNHTAWRDDFRRVVKGRAMAYEAHDGAYQQLMPFENTYGHGGLLTTVGDLLIWNEAIAEEWHDRDKIPLMDRLGIELKEPTVLSNGQPTPYGRGLFLGAYNGEQEVSHSGATAGYRAWLGRYPMRGLSIAILCNASDADTTKLAHSIADLYLPKATLDPPTQIVGPERLAALTGLYEDVYSGLPLRLTVEKAALHIEDGAALTPRAASIFADGPTLYSFDSPDHMTRRSADGETAEFRRAAPWSLDAALLASLPGDYASDEALVIYRLTISDGAVRLAPLDRPSQALDLKPLWADAFAFNTDDLNGVLRLTRNAAGHVTGFTMTTGRVRALAFRRDE